MKVSDNGAWRLAADLSLQETRVLQAVLTAMRQIRYGHVQIILQDGKVVQIERLEKQRLVDRAESR